MRLLVSLMILGILTFPVLALETLNKNHFTVDYVIIPEEECFTGGERLNINYEIAPKISAYRVLIGGGENNPRTYYFQTNLSDAIWRLIIDYYQGGTWDEQVAGKKAQIDAKYFKLGAEERGIAKITVNLTGIVPICNLRLCEFIAITASCEDCETNALPVIKFRVANEEAFKNDIKNLRAKMSDLIEKLKLENIYEEKEFRNVSESINSAEYFLISKKYLDADKKIGDVDESLKTLNDLANKKIAQKLYSELTLILNEIQRMLLNSSVMLEKLKGHENYTELALKQKEHEKVLDDLGNQVKNINFTFLNTGKFTQAIEEMRRIEGEIKTLRSKVEEFAGIIGKERERGVSSTFSLPLISFNIPFNPIYIFLMAVAFIAILIGLKIRKRRKWDELR